MDYEKKYKEALERARKLYKDAITLQLEQDIKDYETIFPELKESEDERIRKALIKFHKSTIDIDGIKGEDIITWLEKQSNTIPDECVFRPVAGCDIESAAKQAIKQQGVLAKKIVLAFNGAYIPVGGKAADIIVNEYNYWLEKQGETYTKRDVDNAYVEGIAFAKDELEKQGEKKPTNKVEPKFKVGDWIVLSTSDGEKVVQIDSIEYFKSGEPRYITSEGRWFGNGTKARLLTDKDVETVTIPESKIVVKQKHAWSEDDEKILRTIISDGIRGAEFDMLQIDWLKSLKQRYTWKPSDGQIHAFKQVYDWYNDNFAPSETLTSLYNDLKKLKGE